MCRQMPGCEPLIGEFAIGTLGEAEVSKGIIKGEKENWKFPTPPKGTRPKSPYQIEHDDFFKSDRRKSSLQRSRTRRNGHHDRHPRTHGDLYRRTRYLGRRFNSERVLGPDKIVDWDTLPRTLPDANLLYKLTPAWTADRSLRRAFGLERSEDMSLKAATRWKLCSPLRRILDKNDECQATSSDSVRLRAENRMLSTMPSYFHPPAKSGRVDARYEQREGEIFEFFRNVFPSPRRRSSSSTSQREGEV